MTDSMFIAAPLDPRINPTGKWKDDFKMGVDHRVACGNRTPNGRFIGSSAYEIGWQTASHVWREAADWFDGKAEKYWCDRCDEVEVSGPNVSCDHCIEIAHGCTRESDVEAITFDWTVALAGSFDMNRAADDGRSVIIGGWSGYELEFPQEFTETPDGSFTIEYTGDVVEDCAGNDRAVITRTVYRND